ncbi:uncharacterized protein LOC110840444 isoform X1 [Zootermopsis nevadensis]|uniref:uncharacterized protein LOC110840444 isoform X1 n=1 Tax=Zootermopsis nevadensis TaxID=136037 RepID=UPI000B8E8812|nr:uncharacterized protein LOC110840444 isoform X1 [Zootermopsis nevadensis]
METLDNLHLTRVPAGSRRIGGMPPHVRAFLIHHPHMLQNQGLLKLAWERLLHTRQYRTWAMKWSMAEYVIKAHYLETSKLPSALTLHLLARGNQRQMVEQWETRSSGQLRSMLRHISFIHSVVRGAGGVSARNSK